MMVKGAVAKLDTLCRNGEVEGIISIGGMSSMIMASNIMIKMALQHSQAYRIQCSLYAGLNRIFGPTGITLMHCLTLEDLIAETFA
ncbi:MAG: hypothetical protein C4554_11210 [Dethiobacter sp.]|jgi:hypothetical protein|nr:MAG: hypothetical protein C4554_11210 [Dethiobacter sp.]